MHSSLCISCITFLRSSPYHHWAKTTFFKTLSYYILQRQLLTLFTQNIKKLNKTKTMKILLIKPREDYKNKSNTKTTTFNPFLRKSKQLFPEIALSQKPNEIKHRVNFAQYVITKKKRIYEQVKKIFHFSPYNDILILLGMWFFSVVLVLKSSYMAIDAIF